MSERICSVCLKLPAEGPDREHRDNKKRVCSRCHAARLLGDLESIERRREPFQPEPWLEFHGCFTGDCPHPSVHACIEHLRRDVAERETELCARLITAPPAPTAPEETE